MTGDAPARPSVWAGGSAVSGEAEADGPFRIKSNGMKQHCSAEGERGTGPAAPSKFGPQDSTLLVGLVTCTRRRVPTPRSVAGLTARPGGPGRLLRTVPTRETPPTWRRMKQRPH